MITKTFTQTYPNEPWNPSISDGNTVEVTWSGIRYHIFSIDANGYFFAIEADGDNKDEIDELAEKLHDNRHKLAVQKSNKGMIKNIKYDKDPILMADLDSLVHKLFELTKKYPFRAAKEKSLVDYQKHF